MPLTRTEMADYLGLRLETVSRRQLKQLETVGIIKRRDPRRISIRDVAAGLHKLIKHLQTHTRSAQDPRQNDGRNLRP
jgi:hypothetical protein